MSHPTPSSVAPWKPVFESQIQKAGGASAEFVLGSITKEGLPRVRYCIHRGFWTALPENSHNKLPRNKKIYDSDCPVFTTDARMHKVYEIFATGKGKGDVAQSRSGSGGGGPVEAVYWVKDIQIQWRIRGRCWFVASDDIEGGESAQNSGTVTVKAEVGRYMRVVDGHDGKDDWSWKLEVENEFENLSPTMRGSFKNPPPGVPITDGTSEPGEGLGQKAGHLKDEELARKNFRVAIITPEEVEQVDLSNPDRCRRWIWKLSSEAGGPGDSDGKPVGEWNMIETWP